MTRRELPTGCRLSRGLLRLVLLVAAGASLQACTVFERLIAIGQTPSLSEIENPAPIANDRQVRLPMPAPQPAPRQANSLWRTGSQHFLQDQRAAVVGDIVTINIEVSDNASISNRTTRGRAASEDASLTSLLGYEGLLQNFLPNGVNPLSLVDLDSAGSTEGNGSVDRGETINLKVAALVTQVLPNGNLVVAGRQEMRINYEVRELQVAGVIRPEDITSGNTIEFEKIAEARIAYGGRGHITDVQQPRYGQQLYDVLWPF